MDPDFWQTRWRSNQIGFHQLEIHPDLRRFYPRLAPRGGGRIFVPMCGKSLDLLWLHGQGLAVLGVELVPQAVDAFFQENALAAQHRLEAVFRRSQWESLEILCGDYFLLGKEELRGVTMVYDRGALEAMPPAMRQGYARHLGQLVEAGTRFLVVAHEYDQEEMAGPPFSIPHSELAALYAASFTIEPLSRRDTLADTPTLRQRGLTWLRENAYLLVKK